MATTKNVKNNNASTSTVKAVQNTAAAANAATNEPATLTVVVVDAKGQPTAGASVSLKPLDLSGVTNSSGEVQFKLGTATKYDVTASYGSNTVTVPYYVTKNGATRLIVNPIYVKAIEKQLRPSSWYSSGYAITGGVGLGIIIVLVILWKMFKKRYRRVS